MRLRLFGLIEEVSKGGIWLAFIGWSIEYKSGIHGAISQDIGKVVFGVSQRVLVAPLQDKCVGFEKEAEEVYQDWLQQICQWHLKDPWMCRDMDYMWVDSIGLDMFGAGIVGRRAWSYGVLLYIQCCSTIQPNVLS